MTACVKCGGTATEVWWGEALVGRAGRSDWMKQDPDPAPFPRMTREQAEKTLRRLYAALLGTNPQTRISITSDSGGYAVLVDFGGIDVHRVTDPTVTPQPKAVGDTCEHLTALPATTPKWMAALIGAPECGCKQGVPTGGKDTR